MSINFESPSIEVITFVPDPDEPVICTALEAVFPEAGKFDRYEGYQEKKGELIVSGPFHRPPESIDGTVKHPGLSKYGGLNSLTISFSGEKSPLEINGLLGHLAVILRDMQTKQITEEQ